MGYAETMDTLLDACIIPLSDVRPSDWYEANMVMPQGSAFPGPFSYNLTPYWREVVDCFDKNHPAKTVSIMKGAQLGGTVSVLIPGTGYTISENPGNILFLTGHSDLSKEAMDGIDMMINGCNLRHLIRPSVLRARNQRTGDTNMSKEFPGGYLKAGSVTNHNLLRQRSVMVMIVDDYDAAKNSGASTGSTKILVEQRQAAFKYKRKTFYISSPQLKGQSNIEEVFKLGDQRYYNVPCPCCGAFIVLKWNIDKGGKDAAGIYFKTDENNRVVRESVGYVCQECAGFFTEGHKYEMNLAGKWVPTATATEEQHYSYQISGLYAPPGMYDWYHYAQQYANANPVGQPQILSKQQTFVNVVLGETFEMPTEEIKANELQKNICDYHPGTVPMGLSIKHGNGKIVLLTCAVDLNGTEDDARLDYEIVAWAESGASYSITHGSIGTFVPREGSKKYKEDREHFTYQHNRHNSVWPLLEQVLLSYWPTDLTGVVDRNNMPSRMQVAITALDTGHYTHYAYNYIDSTNALVMGVKGDKDSKFRKFNIDTPVFHAAKERGKLYILEANQLKDQIAGMMGLKYDSGNDARQPSGFMNYPQPSNGLYTYPGFFEHYEAEHRKTEIKDGAGIATRWEKKNSAVQNHFWDVRCYNLAAREIIVYQLMKEAKVENPSKRTWADFVTLMKGV